MQVPELLIRLEKLLWACNIQQGKHHEGKRSPAAWEYHSETVREAIKQLTQGVKP